MSKHTLEPRLPEWRLRDWPERLTQRLSEWMRMVVADLNRKIGVRKAGTLVGTRDNINLIEGSGVTLTMADDPTNDEVDITIAASGGGGGCCYAKQKDAGDPDLDNSTAQAETHFGTLTTVTISSEDDECGAIVHASLSVRLPPSGSATAIASFSLYSISPDSGTDQVGTTRYVQAPAYDDSKGDLIVGLALHGERTLRDRAWKFFIAGSATPESISVVSVVAGSLMYHLVPCKVYEPI